jgi:phosphate transport system permease protein
MAPEPARASADARIPSWAVWASIGGTGTVLAAILAAVGFNIAIWAVGTTLISILVVYMWARSVEGRRQAFDRAVSLSITSLFALAMVPLVSLLYTVVSKGLARMDAEFFTSSMRGVVGEGGGILHAAIGTFIITGVATLASVPIGIMAAVYLHEYGKGRLKRALTFFVDVMTGIPSIVAGLFAFALFAIFFGPGIRMGVMGSVALSVLMIPIVVRSTEEMLRVVPDGLREASFALGVSKWRTVAKVVLPTAMTGIVTGVMLAVARIIGETAPLLITTGAFSSVNLNPFSGRMENLPVFAYNQYKNPGVPPEPYIDRAWAAALVLILIVMVLFLVARFISRRYGIELRR